MQSDSKHPGGEKPKGKQYPINHKRPKGQIIERGAGRFMVWLHSHTDASGKPVRYTKTFRTLKEADAHLAEKVAEKGRGKSILDTSQRFQDFVEAYLVEVHAPKVRPQTHANVKYYFEHYVFPYIGHRRVRELSSMDFTLLYNKLRDGCAGKPLSSATVGNIHKAINAALKSAVHYGKLSKNPAEKASPGRTVYKEVQTLTETQVRDFLKVWGEYEGETSRHFSKHNLSPIWRLAFEAGTRPEETIGLRWQDLSLDSEPPLIRVRQVVIRNVRLKGFQFGEPKTRKSRRAIPITRELAEALKAHRQSIEKMKARAGSKWKDYDLVFPNTSGEPLYDYRLRLLFKKIVEKIGLDPAQYSLYCTRHTMATLLLLKGVNPKVAAERLGHEGVLQCLNTYSHVLPSLQHDAALTLGEAICGESKEGEKGETAQAEAKAAGNGSPS